MQIKVTGTVEVNKAMRELGPKTRRALAFALNETANDVQQKIQAGLMSRFTLRRADFVKKTIYRQPTVDFADRNGYELRAAVRVHPERNFLAQHEEGGQKTARSGGMVAIPLPAVQPSPSIVVPHSKRPSGMRNDKRVSKVVLPTGTFLVRHTKGSRSKAGRTEFLYQLKRSVPLRPRLGFLDTAEKTVNRVYQRQAIMALDYALNNWR